MAVMGKSKSKRPRITVSKPGEVGMPCVRKRSSKSTPIRKGGFRQNRNKEHVTFQLPEPANSAQKTTKASKRKNDSPTKTVATAKQPESNSKIPNTRRGIKKTSPTGNSATPFDSKTPSTQTKVTPASSQALPPISTSSRLPKNVNYTTKGHGDVTTIGPKLIYGADLNHDRIRFPYGCITYSPKTRELLICDFSNGRVMAVKTDGTNPRIFYTLQDPADITISEDGKFVYILTPTFPVGIVKVRVSNTHKVKRKELGSCSSITCHNQHIAAPSPREKTMFLFDVDLEVVRSFPLDEMTLPRACTVDNDSNFYITDDSNGAVHVYSWAGDWLREFGRYEFEQLSYGICVDGDGMVCVSRHYAHCVDVYGSDGKFVTDIGLGSGYPGELRYPGGLCLLEDGRLVVMDKGSSRLQIL